MEKKIIVLGPNGMLGQMVSTYFQRAGYDVVPIQERYSWENKGEFIRKITESQAGWVINCIGRIKQKTSLAHELVAVNTILPLELADVLVPGQFLIHPSTDCVFEGNLGRPYDIADLSDASDDYGRSKRLGEVALQGKHNALTVRVSIIGPDKQTNPKGLLGWFLSNPPHSIVNGYNNHFWNGITTLEWCKQVEKLILNGTAQQKAGQIIQLAAKDDCSKFDLLNWINEVYERQIIINPFNTEYAVDRRLVGEIIAKPIKTQLEELRLFS